MWFYFAFFLLISLFCIFEENKVNSKYYYLFGFILVLIAGFRDSSICRDYDEYKRLFGLVKESGFLMSIEPTFWLISNISPDIVWLMIIYAIFGVSSNLIGIKILSEFNYISLLLYFSGAFMLHEMTQIRVGVATGFVLISINYIQNHNFPKFAISVLFAAFFHYSALFFFPFYFLHKSKFNKLFYYSLIPVSYLLHFSNIHISSILNIFIIFEPLRIKLEVHQQILSGNSPEINVFNAIQIVKTLLAYIFLIKANIISEKNKYFLILLKIYIYSLASFILFADVAVFAFRLNELLGSVEIVLLPMIIYITYPKKIATSLIILYAFSTLYLLIIYGELLKPYF